MERYVHLSEVSPSKAVVFADVPLQSIPTQPLSPPSASR